MNRAPRMIWYAGLMAAPAVGAFLTGGTNTVEACTMANGPICGCGCSSTCDGYERCSQVWSDVQSCYFCSVSGTNCHDCGSGSSGSGSGGY
jgi:hypothetical protein